MLSRGTFLKILFPDLNDGFIELRSFLQKNDPRLAFYSSIDALMAKEADIEHDAQSRDIYFGVCPRSRKEGGKESVKLVWSLWVDLDVKDFKGGKPEIFECLNSFLFPPTILVQSGNGVHAYWRLKEPVSISTKEDVSRVERYLKGLAMVLNGDPACAELARIFRLPGTFNYKYKPAASVRISEMESSRQYNLSDFDFLPIEVGVAEKKSNSPGWIAEALTGLKEGNRHETFLKVIGRLNHDKWSQNEIIALLAPHAERVSYPLEELQKEVMDICKRYPNGNTFLVSTNIGGETETRSRSFEVMTLRQFLDSGSDQIDWCVDGILPSEGVGIIAAPAGYGKSWMTLDLALECSRGGLWLGQFKTKKTKVLYIDEESSQALLRKRLNKLLKGKEI